MSDTLMSPKTGVPRLVLASGSSTRAAILKGAGLDFIIRKPTVDEASVRRAMIDSNAPVGAGADRLAELKAREISDDQPGALVIGADQILESGYWRRSDSRMRWMLVREAWYDGSSARTAGTLVGTASPSGQ